MKTILVLLAALAHCGLGSAAESGMRPNIVFIITDDQRWDSLGCTGHPAARTPHIDRLADEGALFNNFFVCTPLCSPSRASFLTGLYPHQHRVINNDKLGLDVVSHTLMTFPRQLREAGYQTAFIGKWHMGLDDSRRPGFDHWISFKGQGIYIDGVANHDGQVRQLDGHMTDLLNGWAVDFVDRPHTQPFCLYLSHKAVHIPYLPAQRHESLYENFEFAVPPKIEAEFEGKPVMSRYFERKSTLELEGIAPEPAEPRRGRGRDPQSIVRDQLRCLAGVDEGVGALLAALERTGQIDNTIFIYTSDNGYFLGEHGQMDTKRWPYDEALRVPLLVRYPPRIAAGTKCDAMVLNIDIAPTLLDMAGVDPIVPAHGRSFASLWDNSQTAWRESFLAEYFLEKVAPQVPSWQAVRTERFKYIHYLESKGGDVDGYDELYDLHRDPHELVNLVGKPEHSGTLSAMKSSLVRLLQESR